MVCSVDSVVTTTDESKILWYCFWEEMVVFFCSNVSIFCEYSHFFLLFIVSS